MGLNTLSPEQCSVLHQQIDGDASAPVADAWRPGIRLNVELDASVEKDARESQSINRVGWIGIPSSCGGSLRIAACAPPTRIHPLADRIA